LAIAFQNMQRKKHSLYINRTFPKKFTLQDWKDERRFIPPYGKWTAENKDFEQHFSDFESEMNLALAKNS